MNRSDRQLVVDYLKGDELALEILIKRYLKSIYSFVCRYVNDEFEAEDVTQEVFLRVWRNLKKFDLDKNFKTWIFSIAKNASFDWLKKKKSIRFSDLENQTGNRFLDSLADSNILPDEIFSRAAEMNGVVQVMNNLSLKHRLVLLLYYRDQFNFREIAEILKESLNTVKSRHRRALILLKKKLGF